MFYEAEFRWHHSTVDHFRRVSRLISHLFVALPQGKSHGIISPYIPIDISLNLHFSHLITPSYPIESLWIPIKTHKIDDVPSYRPLRWGKFSSHVPGTSPRRWQRRPRYWSIGSPRIATTTAAGHFWTSAVPTAATSWRRRSGWKGAVLTERRRGGRDVAWWWWVDFVNGLIFRVAWFKVSFEVFFFLCHINIFLRHISGWALKSLEDLMS